MYRKLIGESAVRADRRSNPMTAARLGVLQVRDHVFRRVVGGIRVKQRTMTLPDAFDARTLCDPIVVRGRDLAETGRGASQTFSRTVVHDDNLRLHRIEMRR